MKCTQLPSRLAIIIDCLFIISLAKFVRADYLTSLPNATKIGPSDSLRVLPVGCLDTKKGEKLYQAKELPLTKLL